jgi:hypothetical protein
MTVAGIKTDLVARVHRIPFASRADGEAALHN